MLDDTHSLHQIDHKRGEERRGRRYARGEVVKEEENDTTTEREVRSREGKIVN